ncbi:MAG TPA: hypothetical protein VK447_09560 [Myxococcaceae bacterium]|nr:hypothetical protein [Myxococcaceae bacterium]
MTSRRTNSAGVLVIAFWAILGLLFAAMSELSPSWARQASASASACISPDDASVEVDEARFVPEALEPRIVPELRLARVAPEPESRRIVNRIFRPPIA